ncbi:hypothetical protein ES703_42598 [subsurface metagenome]
MTEQERRHLRAMISAIQIGYYPPGSTAEECRKAREWARYWDAWLRLHPPA